VFNMLQREELMDLIAEEAARAKIKGVDGQEHELKDTWEGRPAVLAFVRHFG
jgi:hypothetical protein